MLKDSNFNAFEISGDKIINMHSHIEGISIPTSGSILTMKVVPLPLKKFKSDLYFKGTGEVLSDVSIEIFNGFGTTLLKLSHPGIQLELNYTQQKFNFTFKKYKSLKHLEETLSFLLTLLKGNEPLYTYLNEERQEIKIIQMNPLENIVVREELVVVFKIIETLKEIQQYYRVIFRDFKIDFSEDTIKKIELLKLHMTKKHILIDTAFFTTKDLIFYEEIMNHEDFVEEIVRNKKEFGFDSKKFIESINLLNQDIEINSELITQCDDAHIVSYEEYYDDGLNYFYIKAKSAQNGIKITFNN